LDDKEPSNGPGPSNIGIPKNSLVGKEEGTDEEQEMDQHQYQNFQLTPQSTPSSTPQQIRRSDGIPFQAVGRSEGIPFQHPRQNSIPEFENDEEEMMDEQQSSVSPPQVPYQSELVVVTRKKNELEEELKSLKQQLQTSINRREAEERSMASKSTISYEVSEQDDQIRQDLSDAHRQLKLQQKKIIVLEEDLRKQRIEIETLQSERNDLFDTVVTQKKNYCEWNPTYKRIGSQIATNKQVKRKWTNTTTTR